MNVLDVVCHAVSLEAILSFIYCVSAKKSTKTGNLGFSSQTWGSFPSFKFELILEKWRNFAHVFCHGLSFETIWRYIRWAVVQKSTKT